jgi:hypothetical protein
MAARQTPWLPSQPPTKSQMSSSARPSPVVKAILGEAVSVSRTLVS